MPEPRRTQPGDPTPPGPPHARPATPARPDTPSGTTNPNEAAEGFTKTELRIIEAHFGLGPAQSVWRFHRGSEKSPKLVVKTARGLFLIKRRTLTPKALQRLAVTHEIQLKLASQSYPVAALVGTSDGGQSILKYQDHVYEVSHFLTGDPFDQSPRPCRDSGKLLARFHDEIADMDPRPLEVFGPTFHRAPHTSPDVVRVLSKRMCETQSNLSQQQAQDLAVKVVTMYDRASQTVDREYGYPDWPRVIVHGDWHPGNMIYRNGRAMAVVDFDDARIGPRAIDVAYGALHFSIVTEGTDPRKWPDELDQLRWRAFFAGYDEYRVDMVLSRAEIHAMPWLMVEALLLESIKPVLAHGRFGNIAGYPFLETMLRKATWLRSHAERLARLLGA